MHELDAFYYKLNYSKTSANDHLYVIVKFFSPVKCCGKNTLRPLYSRHSN